MSLLSQKHFNRSAKRNVSMMENHELKILNMFIKYMAYYSDTELTAFTDWIENNTKFELYQDLKVLHIGTYLKEVWTHQLQVERFEIEIIDQSLLNVNVTKKKLMDTGINISIGQMEYTNLIYESYTFDRVFSKIAFRLQSAEQQIESLNEASRVLKPTGIHYILVNEQSLISSLYQLMNEFSNEFNIIDPYQKHQIDIDQQLKMLYEQIDVTEYEANHLIRDVKQCMSLFLSYEDENYINYIVKRHLGKQFNEFLEMKFKTQGPIILKRKFRLFKCKNKKNQLKQF